MAVVIKKHFNTLCLVPVALCLKHKTLHDYLMQFYFALILKINRLIIKRIKF